MKKAIASWMVGTMLLICGSFLWNSEGIGALSSSEEDHTKEVQICRVVNLDGQEEEPMDNGIVMEKLSMWTAGTGEIPAADQGAQVALDGDSSKEELPYAEESETDTRENTEDETTSENSGESEAPMDGEMTEENTPEESESETSLYSGNPDETDTKEQETREETEEYRDTEVFETSLPETEDMTAPKEEQTLAETEEELTEMEVLKESEEVSLLVYENLTEAEGAPVGNKVEIFQPGMEWPSGYEHYFSGKTQSSTPLGFSSDLYPEGFTQQYSVSLKAANKGKIGVRYQKVGKYMGHDVDMEVIAVDWGDTKKMMVGGTYTSIASFEKGDILSPNVAFSKARPRFFVTGTDYVDFAFRFYISGTNTPIEVKGRSTAVDVDAKQGVKFLDGIAGAYISGDSELLVDKNNKVYTEDSGNTTSDDKKHWVAYYFSSPSHTIRFYCGGYWDRLNHGNATETYGYSTAFDIVEFQPDVFAPVNKICHVTVTKKDSESGELLTGAGFTLSQWSMEKNSYVSLGELIDAKDGSYEFRNLSYSDDNQGMFLVEETKAPPFHTNSGWKQEFTMDGKDTGYRFTYTAEDPPIKAAIRIHKTDQENGKGLKGALYTVYQDPACTKKVAETSKTDETGNCTTPMFRKTQDIYYVQETVAPDTYFRDKNIFQVKVSDNQTVTVERTNERAEGKLSVAKAADGTSGIRLNPDTGRYEGTRVPGSYGPGESFYYYIQVTNTGNTEAKEIQVKDTPDEKLLEYLEENGIAFDLSDELKTQKGASIKARILEEEPLSLELDCLSPGDSVSLAVQCKLKTEYAFCKVPLSNRVSVTGYFAPPDRAGIKPIPTDEDDVDQDEILVVYPRILVAKLAEKTTGVVLENGKYQGEKLAGRYGFGETVKYDILVSNVGDVNALDVQVKEELGEELKKVMVLDSAAFESLDNLVSLGGKPVNAVVDPENPLHVTLDMLEPGDCVSLPFSLQIRDEGEASEDIPNRVSVSGKYPIPGKELTPDIPKGDEDQDKISICDHSVPEETEEISETSTEKPEEKVTEKPSEKLKETEPPKETEKSAVPVKQEPLDTTGASPVKTGDATRVLPLLVTLGAAGILLALEGIRKIKKKS